MDENLQFLKYSHDHNVKLAYNNERNTFFLTSEDLLSSPRYSTPMQYNCKVEQRLSDSATTYDTTLFQNERIAYISENEVLPSDIDELVEDVEEEFENFLLSKSSRSGYSTPDPKPLFSLSDDFNTAFQKVLKELAVLDQNSSKEKKLHTHNSLIHVTQEFIHTVTTYGRIIISEVYLPTEKKTIRPAIEIGGIAGGEKYIVNNILFKFAVDSKGLYNGDEFAMKAAGHEIKSWAILQSIAGEKIHFPLISILDYRGFRLIAMTFLPISNKTLILGSSDAGKTVKYDPDVAPLLNDIGTKLNLALHKVGEPDIYSHFPVDLEVHRGEDGLIYLIDFARTFPPEAPSLVGTKEFLYKLLRPELVLKSPIPLCADAFSSFNLSPNRYDHNAQIRDLSEKLKSEVIPNFVSFLLTLPEDLREIIDLDYEIHLAGINFRYLGLIRQELQRRGDQYWSSILIIEMVARVLKQSVRYLLRTCMKLFKYPGEGIYRREVIRFLNIVFGTSPVSNKYWNQMLFNSVLTKYISIGSIENGLKNTVINSTIPTCNIDGRCMLIKILANYLGIRFTTNTWKTISTSNSLFKYGYPFDEMDIKEMREILKPPNIITLSQGIVLKLKAMYGEGAEKVRLLTLAIDCLKKSLDLFTTTSRTLRILGDCYSILGDQRAAYYYYEKALSITPTDINTLYHYATTRELFGDMQNAERLTLKAIDLSPSHSRALTYYADFLAFELHMFKEAEKFYLISLKYNPLNVTTWNNYALFLTLVKKDYNRASKFFQKSILLGKNTTAKIQLYNYSTFLNHYPSHSDLSDQKSNDHLPSSSHKRRVVINSQQIYNLFENSECSKFMMESIGGLQCVGQQCLLRISDPLDSSSELSYSGYSGPEVSSKIVVGDSLTSSYEGIYDDDNCATFLENLAKFNPHYRSEEFVENNNNNNNNDNK